ncbi:phosphotransferase [Mycoplasma iguanae]|uniref:Phosphotransferase n=1 Tax=Mycoplasma iguanae TaxID=292461 RepID=A0ABY5R964_9MOLU|nr:phosphotransferase [Mycoplasma iguanae]UVD81707.1 phosphotransferase [Mycoplasma iguanae]
MKTQIKTGHTNISYHKDNLFIQEKIKNPFNHNIDYSILEKFDFVPKLIFNSPAEIHWEWIEGKQLEITNDTIVKMAHLMKTIHNSKLDFPASNHAARVKAYRKILNEKNINLEILNKYYKKINLILKNMDKNTPLHNDLWDRNILVDKNNKIWIVDWEYATKGDKHFDLAYFIESCRLTDQQETLLLNEYDDYDYEYIIQQKIFVNYLIILWIWAQKIKPFDDKEFHEKIEFLVLELERYKKKWNTK